MSRGNLGTFLLRDRLCLIEIGEADMSDELTLDKAKKAAQFGSQLCEPVAYMIQKYEDKLPADKVLAVAPELALSRAYITTDSGLPKYYYQALVEFKKLLKTSVSADLLARYFDPAIMFFKTHLEKRTPIKINCLDRTHVAAPPLVLPMANNKIDHAAVKKYLVEKLGFNFEGLPETWLKHRVVFSDIKKGKDLVIIIGEEHNSVSGVLSCMELFDKLYKANNRINLRLALEMSPAEMEAMKKQFSGSETHKRFTKLWFEGHDAVQILKMTLKKYFADQSCVKMVMRETGMAYDYCLNPSRLSSLKKEIYYSIMGGSHKTSWALEDAALKESRLVVMKLMDEAKQPDELFALSNIAQKLDVKRSFIMADNLAKKMHEDNSDGRPRVILLSTGGGHVYDMIRRLKQNNNVSIIGLVHSKLGQILIHVANDPEKRMHGSSTTH